MTKFNEKLYDNICDSINKIFINIDEIIRKDIFEVCNIKTRKVKLSFKSSFLFSLMYTKNDVTQKEVVNELKLLNEIDSLNRTSLTDKDKLIPFKTFKNIFEKLSNLYLNYFKDDTLKKIIAVDGIYNNTNVLNIKGFLETSLNLGFFDVSNSIPIDLTFEGLKGKNNELKSLIDYINDNNEKFKNVILILDRAYCSYKLIDFLNKKKINYVCRFKNSCKNFDKLTIDVRVIEFTNYSYENVPNHKTETKLIDNKKFSNIQIKIKNEYKLITNLTKNSYTDDEIKDLYHKRWDVEVFFKLLRKKFKFSDLRNTSIEQTDNFYNIYNIKMLIICILSKIFEKAYEKIHNIKLEGNIKKRKYKNKK